MSQSATPPPNPPITFQACLRCGAGIKARRGFEFKNRSGVPSGDTAPILKCLTCALRHAPMLRRSIIAALVVGTILTLLNQGDILLSGSWNNGLYWKIPLTYCVPFMVATYGALSNSRT